MKKVENQRRFAVGVTLIRAENGKLRLILDDLQTGEGGVGWEKRCLFTYIDVDEEEARKYSLDRASYASIGDALLARLLAVEDDS